MRHKTYLFVHKIRCFFKSTPVCTTTRQVINSFQINPIEQHRGLRDQIKMEASQDNICSNDMLNSKPKKKLSTSNDQTKKEKYKKKKCKTENDNGSSASSDSRPCTWFLALPSKKTILKFY